jgi:hypothetical protein
MQVQESPCTEPIENFMSLWKTPPVLVATLEIAKQEIDEYSEMCDNIAFHPMRTTADHWPIGGINRMRQGIYSISQMYRLHANTGVKGGCNNGCSLGDGNPFTFINSCKTRDDGTPFGPCRDKRSLVDGNSYSIGPYNNTNTEDELRALQKKFKGTSPPWVKKEVLKEDQSEVLSVDPGGTRLKDKRYFYDLGLGPDSSELDYSGTLPGFECPFKNDQAKLDSLYA